MILILQLYRHIILISKYVYLNVYIGLISMEYQTLNTYSNIIIYYNK